MSDPIRQTARRNWLEAPATPLERHLAACHRYYIACRDRRPEAERDALLAEADRLAADITPSEHKAVAVIQERMQQELANAR